MAKVVESRHYADQGGRACGPLAAFDKYHCPTKLKTMSTICASAQIKGQSSHWQSQVLKASSLSSLEYSCSTAENMTHRAKQFSWCGKKKEKRLKSTDSSEFNQPSCMGHIRILCHLPHANQAGGTASHLPFSPLLPAAPQMPFPVPITEQHGELSCS